LLLQGWARDGLNDEQIAHNMGIGARTLYTYQEKFEPIRQALKKGKEVVDFAVENALLNEALKGNVTAQIFWLANRRKDKWRRNPQPNGSEGTGENDNLYEAIAEAVKNPDV
jgi:hypothetical protein